MRILLVTDSYPPAADGHAVAVRWWEQQLAHAGHEVLLSTPARPRLWGPKPDVLFVHGYGVRAALPIALLPQVPIVSFVHRHTYKDIPQLLARFPWLVPTASCYVYNRQQRFLQYSQHIIVPSQFAADLTALMAPHLPITVLPTGVDEAFLHAAGSATPPATPTVLYLGRRTAEKEFTQFISAANTEPAWKWHALGSAGPNDAQAQEAGITLAPNTNRAGVIRALQKASVLLFPSRIETQGLVATEALTIGVPVVAPEGSAQAEQITPGINGALYDPAAGPEAIRNALQSAIQLGVVAPNAHAPTAHDVVASALRIFRSTSA